MWHRHAPHAWLGLAQVGRESVDIFGCPLGNWKSGAGFPV